MSIVGSKLRKKSSESSSTTIDLSSLYLNLPSLARSSSVHSITTLTSVFTYPTVTINPPFPLLQLPSVVIHEVLKTMIPFELVHLSFASKKTKYIVKSSIKRSYSKNFCKLKVTIDDCRGILQMKLYCGERKLFVIYFASYYDMWARNTKDSQLSESLMQFGDVSIHLKINQNMDRITAYWKFRDSAVETMLQYIIKFFNPVISIEFKNVNEFLVSGTLNVVKQANANLEEVSMSIYFACPRVYQDLLGLSIRKLTISDFPVNPFCYKAAVEPIKFDELTITEACWITELEAFLHCRSICLKEIELKEEDCNKFLKKWMESNHPLEYAWISVNDFLTINLTSVVKELSATPMSRAYVDGKICDFEDGKCFGLQKRNGEKATVYQLDDSSVIIQAKSYRDSPVF